MSKLPETYLYEVINNRKIIKLEGGVEIRSPKSLYLTKEDVLTCLESAYVYRRFAAQGIERQRVTKLNLDRLHRSTFISEEEWKVMQEASPVAAPEEVLESNKELKVEEPEPIVEEPSSETVEEVTVSPDELEELTPTDGDIQENPVESEADEYYEAVEQNGIVVDEESSIVTDDSDSTTEQQVADEVVEDNGMGVPEDSEQNVQPNAGKHYYKHNKKKH